jgi:hypothetical protein
MAGFGGAYAAAQRSGTLWRNSKRRGNEMAMLLSAYSPGSCCFLRRKWCSPAGGNMTAMQDDMVAEAQFANPQEDMR